MTGVIDPGEIPSSLWAAGELHLPAALWAAYTEQLIEEGLLQTAQLGTIEKGIHGGAGAEESRQHFAYRFGNSSARIHGLLLDPRDRFSSVPRELLSSLTSHDVAVLDIPCGAGAAVVALVALLSELRTCGRLAKLPLTLHITAADVSPTSLQIYERMMARIQESAKRAGILLKCQTQLWDAARADQTSQLCDNWFAQSTTATEHLVLMSNLSGVGRSTFATFERSFQHVGERLSNRAATLLWIEPAGESVGKVLDKGMSLMDRTLKWFGIIEGRHEWRDLKWFHHLEKKSVTGGITVLAYVRK